MKTLVCLLVAICFIAGAEEVNFPQDIHPWAFYLLVGEAPYADRINSVLSVDVDAVRNSNAVYGLRTFQDKGWQGFHSSTNLLTSSGIFDFKYKILKTGSNNDAFVQCVYLAGGSDTFSEVLHVRVNQITIRDYRKSEKRRSLMLMGLYTVDEYRSVESKAKRGQANSP